MTVYYHRWPNCPYINDKEVTLYMMCLDVYKCQRCEHFMEIVLPRQRAANPT